MMEGDGKAGVDDMAEAAGSVPERFGDSSTGLAVSWSKMAIQRILGVTS